MRALRWRAAFTVASAALVIGYFWASGRGGYTLQIDYTWTGEYLDGAEVWVDGAVIGTLEPYGRSQRQTGFSVEPGEYKVRVTRSGCDAGREYDVTVGNGGPRLVVLMADIEDGYDCRVVLR